MKKMTTRQMAADSMLAAMCAVLGAVALDVGNLKITLESVPIIVGALLFGSLDGAAIGFVGTLVYQLLRYGVSVTTLLWILPYVVCAADCRPVCAEARLLPQHKADHNHRRHRGACCHHAEHRRNVHRQQDIRLLFRRIHLRLHRRALRDMRRQGDSHRRTDAAAGAAAARKGLQGRVIWFIQCLLILRGECSDDCT